ncbi:hypothetical protein [Anoxybacteroides amylolyticum]|uniref:Putative spore coat regulator YlbO domain protein n=1 Tax=Anoxybacteroides amylolyticum TaxID=294699 RepID=A0A160F2V5_9BACL|nr:hypothetical protein [Anoxybacillus amylolyticus]ANB60599.1 putative spore coat regulator YlbO domain protein [Anoxybacillus amylolyticus]
MKAKQAEDIVLLKQRIIYLQSELARYKAKAYEDGDILLENERLKEALEKAETKIKELTKQVEAVMAENVVLKELALLSEQRYEELEKVKQEKSELEKQLGQSRSNRSAEDGENWFLHTLRQQNAIVKQERNELTSLSNPFSFSGEEE